MKKTALVLLTIMFVSCAEKLIEQPENLIPQDKMTAILYDLSLLVAAKNTNKAVLIENDIKIMEYLYSKYKIDSIQFVQSDLYYASIPEVYETIYKEVETRLDTKKKQIQDARLKKTDSTINANKKRTAKKPEKPTPKKVD